MRYLAHYSVKKPLSDSHCSFFSVEPHLIGEVDGKSYDGRRVLIFFFLSQPSATNRRSMRRWHTFLLLVSPGIFLDNTMHLQSSFCKKDFITKNIWYQLIYQYLIEF